MENQRKLEIDWCGAADQPCIVPVQRGGRGGAKRWRVGWNKRGELLEMWECGFAIGQKRRDPGDFTEKLKLKPRYVACCD
jgi:hypothetical protein